jgi:hypothetical protein
LYVFFFMNVGYILTITGLTSSTCIVLGDNIRDESPASAVHIITRTEQGT